MLKVERINKSYNHNLVLKNINLDFKTTGMYFILGPSGSGKSTLLNLIGALDKPDDGNIIIDNEKLKYKNKKLDTYHLNTVSFIFQEYNLIPYMTVLDNINLSIRTNKIRTKEILTKLNIYQKRNSLIKNLSGGEKQRVAIARALLKESNIILCDEPTGALDSENSKNVMEILKEISKEKLVIIVSHDIYLSKTYADRIINIEDGETIYDKEIDSKTFNINKNYKIKKSYLTKLAMKNLLLNKKRTILTSLASSIGIICLLLVSFLSTGFTKEINDLEESIVKVFPITITNSKYEEENKNIKKELSIKEENKYIHTNIITAHYINYLNNIKEIKHITYDYNINIPLVTDSYKFLDNNYLSIIPSKEYIKDNYDLIKGRNINSIYETLLVIDNNNQISSNITDTLNIENNISYEDLINRKIRIILNDNLFYEKDKIYLENNDIESIYNKDNIEITIVGIVKEKENNYNQNKLLINNYLLEEIINKNKVSKVVNNIKDKDYIIPSIDLNKEELLSFLGYNTLPSKINIYVNNISDKDKVLKELDNYNKINTKIIYEDNMQDSINVVKDFTKIVTIILVLFSLISLFVSSIMISILTNTRVLERVKEIGILRSLGLSKQNIKNIFNKENAIISIISSIIAFVFILILKNPLNNFLYNYLESNTIFKINLKIAFIIFIFNIFITIISGLIPAIKAGKKPIVECFK